MNNMNKIKRLCEKTKTQNKYNSIILFIFSILKLKI